MERGTVEWNSGMVEQAINDPVPFLLANWACALENYRYLYKLQECFKAV